MRKKTVEFSLKTLFDNVYWYIVYLLPVLMTIAYVICSNDFVNYSAFLESAGFGMVNDNIILQGLSAIFLQGGVLPLFSSNLPLLYVSWFIGAFIVHLFVDFVLFIPRLCHKWLSAFNKED